MKEVKSVFCSVILLMTILGVSRGEQTNSFSVKLNDQWATHDANKVITFVVDQYQSHTNDPKRIFARAIVATYLQQWNREATNCFIDARHLLSVSTNYLSKTKTDNICKKIDNLVDMCEILMDDVNEPVNSGPHPDTNRQAVIFDRFSSKFPYVDVVNAIENNEKNIKYDDK